LELKTQAFYVHLRCYLPLIIYQPLSIYDDSGTSISGDYLGFIDCKKSYCATFHPGTFQEHLYGHGGASPANPC